MSVKFNQKDQKQTKSASDPKGVASQAVPDRTVAIEAQTFVWVPLINFKIKSNQIGLL